MKSDISKWFRICLGVFLIIYAANQFLHFFPTGYNEMPEDARNFIDGVAVYLPFLYIFEMVIGLFLIFNKWSSFILIVLAPLTVSFLIFTIANKDLTETWPALFVAFVNIFLLVNKREKYKPLFD